MGHQLARATHSTNMKTYILLAVVFAAFGLAAAFSLNFSMEMDREEHLFNAVDLRKGENGDCTERYGYLYFKTKDPDTKCQTQAQNSQKTTFRKTIDPCENEKEDTTFCMCRGMNIGNGIKGNIKGNIFFGKPFCGACQISFWGGI